MCASAFVYVCVCVKKSVCVRMCVRERMCVCVCMRACACVCVCVFVRQCVYAHVFPVCVRLCVFPDWCVCVCLLSAWLEQHCCNSSLSAVLRPAIFRHPPQLLGVFPGKASTLISNYLWVRGDTIVSL